VPVVLYHHPGSLCSQKVRLALAEKGVRYEARAIDIGPRAENFQPWYVRLNPKAVVPTLVHDGAPVTDSSRIVRYIDERFDGPPLHAADEAGRADEARWLERADALPLRELSYGGLGGPFGWLLRRTDGLRLRKLAKLRDQNPDLREIYEAKIEDVKEWFATARNPAAVGEIVARVARSLDELDAHLAGRDFIGGARYGAADVLWTVVLARLCVLGMRPGIEARPRLRAYYERVRARPSFAAARVWDRMPVAAILRSLLGIKDR
jgi:glutathione S-transferase